VQQCSFIGNNGGVAWLEEDARCPYDGTNWRLGGTDELMSKTFVTNNNCIEYGKEYNGTLVDNVLSDVQKTDTPFECQGLCWNMSGCVAFTWSGVTTLCTMFSKVETFKFNNNSVSGLSTCRAKEKVGCPDNHIKLDSFTCVKFLDDSDQCRDGCSRFTAMEECEMTGGFLLDNVGDDNLDHLFDQIGSRSQFQKHFWWTGASDFSKKGQGKFTWEKSDVLLSNKTSLWMNTTTHDIAGLKQGDSHQCVYLGPSNSTLDIRLDHTDCRYNIAKPLCQYMMI